MMTELPCEKRVRNGVGPCDARSAVDSNVCCCARGQNWSDAIPRVLKNPRGFMASWIYCTLYRSLS
jgi:hypothetical protein